MDVDSIVRNIYISLLVPKGSFELNPELGSELPELVVDDWDRFDFEFKRLLNDVLLDFDDVSLTKVEFEITKTKVHANVFLMVEGEEQLLEFDFKRKGGDLIE